MNGVLPVKLLCTWHVDKAWKEELKKKNSDLAIEVEVYKMLRTILEQTDEKVFSDLCIHSFNSFPCLERQNPFWSTLGVTGFPRNTTGHTAFA